MKFIAILVTFVVAFVGSSCAASTEQQHGRKLGKKSAKSAKAGNPMNYFSLLSAAQRDLTLCPISNVANNHPPPTALGNGIASYDNLLPVPLCVRLTYGALSSAPTTISINGPATALLPSGPVIFTFSPASISAGTTSGSAFQCFPSTDVQKQLLDSDLLYFNIITNTALPSAGTPTCPSGELRGQILPTP
jgi:hypothetical protein